MAHRPIGESSQPIRARGFEKSESGRLVVLGFSELFLLSFNLKGIIPFQSDWFSFNFSRHNGQIRRGTFIFPATIASTSSTLVGPPLDLRSAEEPR